MKRLLFIGTLMSLLCFSLVSTSCKKDKDEDETYVENWSFPIEIHNRSSSPVRVYINGKEEEIIIANYQWVTTYNVTNQNYVSIVVKTSDGKIMASKDVTKGDSFVTTIKDPTFTITKIELLKWHAGNIIDSPDPWIRITSGDDVIGRTNYLSNRSDGAKCTYSDLSITINNVYSKISFSVYDYNLSYTTSGSSFISGVYTTNFINKWGQSTIDMETDKLHLTIYGTWN